MAHRRGCRRPGRRPFQGVGGPTTTESPGCEIWPDSRSCTYCRKAAFVASLADFGRLAERSACHWAKVAR